jgi:hypothetical protein
VEIPDFGKVALSAGGSIGHGAGATRAGAELTLKLRYFGPSFSLGLTGVGGSYLYGEASYWYWVSFGLGAGYRLAGGGPALSPFLGLPIPITLPARSRVAPYLEPYFRPQIALGGRSAVELGVLLKINVALVPDLP